MTGALYETRIVLAAIIFAAVYIVMALGRLPYYRIDRAGAALLGASLMVALGPLSAEEAYRAVDFSTITLLLGMMIVVANLRVAGFFHLVNRWINHHVNRPLTLLMTVVAASGVLSAFLVNDTVCLVMTPLVLELVLDRRRDPTPYLLAIAMASNAGSLATIAGNPQNMIISSLSGISYTGFVVSLAPVAVMSLVLVTALIVLAYRREFFGGGRIATAETVAIRRGPLLAKATTVLAAVIVLFFLGFPPAIVAIVGGSVLLLTRRIKPQRIYAEIDWPMLVMFVGLFIVVAGLEKAVVSPDLIMAAGRLHLDDPGVLSAATAVLSNLVSNVPAVLVLKPFLGSVADPQRAWLVVAMASTLAGNFTIVGSVANLIVAQRAKAYGVDLGFWAYFRVGMPLTLLTIAIGTAWLALT